jgi:hypothetical protein
MQNPCDHPLYTQEWNSFWNRRYQELLSEGKNPDLHDFEKEWISFWRNRLNEILATEVCNLSGEQQVVWVLMA